NGEAKPQSQPEPAQPTPAQPAPLPEEKPQPVEPVPVFDAAAFHEVVLKDVGPKYTEINPCTIFYEARDKGLVTKVDHISQAVDYWDYLIDLAQEGFQHIWGYTLEEAIAKVNETGCPTCPTCPGSRDIDSKARQAGMSFYAILLELRRIMRKRQDIYQLAQCDIDWKSKLGTQHQTLYGLGELAEELMRTG
ncbi:MAG: hypothetical protein PHQ43_10020, partial [Dehalococcoidales bacterium]|nr:hypothetical protein [Dehalococcoidales bacterium]